MNAIQLSSIIRPVFCPSARNSLLSIVGDGAGWVLDHEARELARLMTYARYNTIVAQSPIVMNPVFFLSRSAALKRIMFWHRLGVSISMPYFHGYPGEGVREFDETYALFRKHHSLISRVQVTHEKMYEILLQTGIPKEKLSLIRIGVNSSLFFPATAAQRSDVRGKYGIPDSAIVVGSFQKDGIGWGSGDQPKLIKGPDILIQALRKLKQSVPELFVLLAGAARGCVVNELIAAGIPYRHVFLKDVQEIAGLYHALDAYIVSSRQEGGPKAILESMASAVPIISTRVGQATELIRQGENGWLAEVEDAEGLAYFALKSLTDSAWLSRYKMSARKTAEENDYMAQIPLWQNFFDGMLRPK